MAKEFKVTLDFETKDDISIADIQRYFRNLCHNNGDLKSFKVKTEVKKS